MNKTYAAPAPPLTVTTAKPPEAPPAFKYCLYARKSTEQEERQVLSIDSQIKEMLELAARDGINVVEIRRESHSAKATGQRPVFNELLTDIRAGKFNGILTWAADRLSRNAGDLGALVDLMDQGLLKEIRAHGQTFTNNPNEKFLLMILGSQAKLENDHRGINVTRGLHARVEMGLWPGVAPLGYLNQGRLDRKCQIIVDEARAPIVKQMFEKVAHEAWSGRKVFNWLKFDMNFKTRGNKTLTASGIYRMLDNPFYYGMIEYPRGSGKWSEGKHKPIITKVLFEKAQAQLKRDNIVRQNREFAFTKLMTCGYCGAGVSAQEKYKTLSDGTAAKYVYYGCTRGVDRNCKNTYIREEELVGQLLALLDKLDLNELGIRMKLEEEAKRFSRFQKAVLKAKGQTAADVTDVDLRAYAKYLLKDGSVTEQRELLINLKSKLIYKDRELYLQ
jgi:DNA invertase Pin-like site-specific DNA recombinase